MIFRISVLWFFLLVQDTGWVVYQDAEVVRLGAQFEISLHFLIKEEFHVQSAHPVQEDLFSTRVDVHLPAGWKLLGVAFPETVPFRIEGTEQVLSVYSEELVIRVFVDPSGSSVPGSTITGVLHYQACDRVKCYFPRELEFKVNF